MAIANIADLSVLVSFCNAYMLVMVHCSSETITNNYRTE